MIDKTNENLMECFRALQERAEKLGPVDPSFDQKVFADAFYEDRSFHLSKEN